MVKQTSEKKFGFVLNKGKHVKKNITTIKNTIKSLQENHENDAKLKKQLEEQILTGGGGGNGDYIFDGKMTSHLVPDKHDHYDIGSETNKFRSLYVGANTIYIGNSSIGSTLDGGLTLPSNIKIGESSISTTTEGLKFPSNIQIGESSISSAGGNLTLPDTFKVGATEISTKDGAFKVGELDLAALKIKGGINDTSDLSNFANLQITILAGDTFVYGNDLYVALVDNAIHLETHWRKIEVKGSQGVQGLTGDTGDQGIQGVQGLKGDTGDQGIQGGQGLKGDTGDQGIQGGQGLKGDTGDQ